MPSPQNLVLIHGNTDAYVAKYDASGNIIWLKQFGGSLADKAVDLAIGPDQNIVVTGHFFGTVTFGATTLSSSSNSKDIFLLKLDPNGNVLWVKKEGGSLGDNSNKVTIDNQNNVILTGEYEGVSTIGLNTFTSMTDPTTNQPSYDLFISKYSAAGVPLWSLSGYALYDDRGLAVAIDGLDNIFFTGQFSDNLQLGSNNYTNNAYNVGFVCKINPNGQIQFLNQLKAGLVIPYDIKVNTSNEAIVAGDFLGNMNYYDQTGPHLIQNPYDKQVFVLKTSNTGNYTWHNTLGSNNELSLRSLAIDPANNIFTTGYFKCDLSQLQDSTNQFFSSVGFKDPYLIKWGNAGNRIYSKQIGGKLDDEGKGVAVKTNDAPIICGSYTSDLIFMPGVSILGNNNYSFNAYSGAEPYHFFLIGDQSRNSFVSNQVNSNYPNYNYFKPPSNDSLEGYIWGNTALGNVNEDTVHFCTTTQLNYETLSYNHMGPDYSLQWYDGTQGSSSTISSSGYYWVINSRVDGCKVEVDSVFAQQEPIPNLPLMTDDMGVNTNQPGPNYNNYHLCYPDSTQITFSNLDPGCTLTTYGNSVIFYGLGPHNLNQELQYFVTVNNQYCQAYGSFIFLLDYAITPDSIDLSIAMLTPNLSGDSIVICEGDPVLFHGIDLIVNPNANFYPSVYPPIDSIAWHINGVSYANYDTASTIFSPNISGWYTVDLTLVKGYNNLCGIDTTIYHASKQFYITVNPLPAWTTSLSGQTVLCPNENTFLVASNPNPNLSWSGSNILWSNNYDSIEVNTPGWYYYGGIITDTNSGCFQTFNFSNYVGIKIPPTISTFPSDGVICPFDSLYMTVPGTYTNYYWIGPSGDTLSTTNECYTSQIGFYSCIIVDADGCELMSLPFEVFEYATPSINVTPQAILCNNESVEIQINTSGNAAILWLNNGSTTDHLTTNTPGIYIVQITQCGITLTDTVEIIDGTLNPIISVSDSTLCAGDSALFTGNLQNIDYTWNTGQITGSSFQTTTPGSYYATVTNNFGCSAQTNTITITNVPNSTPPSINNPLPCVGGTVILSDNGQTLNWYNADTNLLFSSPQITLTNIQADTLFVVAYSNANMSCNSSFATVFVDVQTIPTSLLILGDSVLCVNDGTTLHAVTNDAVVWTINGTIVGNQNPINLPYSAFANTNIIQVELTNACYQVTFEDSVQLIMPTPIFLEDDTLIVCYFDTEVLSLATPNIDSLIWNGTIQSSTFTVFGNQQYAPITVFGFDQFGCQTESTTAVIITSNYSLQTNLDLPNFCPGTIGTLSATTTSDSLNWILPGNTSNSNPFNFTLSQTNSGLFYIATWDDLGCAYLDSIFVPISPIPNLAILPDTIFCLNDLYTVYFPNDGNTYSLTPASASVTVNPNEPILITVLTTDGCIATDTLVFQTVNCDNSLPNIITPNGDGTNEYFIIDDAYSQLNNTLLIFNRWGNRIFEASPYKNDFNGFDVVDGVYFYVYYPQGIKKSENYKTGYLEIIR